MTVEIRPYKPAEHKYVTDWDGPLASLSTVPIYDYLVAIRVGEVELVFDRKELARALDVLACGAR